VSLVPVNDRDGDGLRSVALRAGRGDRDALTALIEATAPIVWRACATLVDAASADDLTQDTYVRAMRSLPSYRGESSPVRWLLAIARRVCADEIAGRQRNRQTITRLQLERRRPGVEPALAVELTDALLGLPQPRLDAFLLTVVAGLSYAEAAAVCDCPIGTIRSRVARARDDLQRALFAGDDDGSDRSEHTS